jgi:hypothetical protein
MSAGARAGSWGAGPAPTMTHRMHLEKDPADDHD